MTKAECHGCVYCQKPKGKKRYWCMVPRSNTPLKDMEGCTWWHHFGKDREARKHKENIHNIKTQE